jgi:hypothetical protein
MLPLLTSHSTSDKNGGFICGTEVFPCFFLSCKANARVKLAKTGHDPHSSTLVVICVVRLLFVLFGYLCCSVYCLCVNVYCHRMTTQLQLISISYHIYLVNDSLLLVYQRHVLSAACSRIERYLIFLMFPGPCSFIYSNK